MNTNQTTYSLSKRYHQDQISQVFSLQTSHDQIFIIFPRYHLLNIVECLFSSHFVYGGGGYNASAFRR